MVGITKRKVVDIRLRKSSISNLRSIFLNRYLGKEAKIRLKGIHNTKIKQ